MAIEIDGVLKEWGDRLYYLRPKGRQAPRTVARGRAKGVAARMLPQRNIRAILDRTVRRVPEVMVKITRGRMDPATGKRNVPCKDMKSIKAHLDYISRNGKVPLEDEQGNEVQSAEGVRDLRDHWEDSGGVAIPYSNGYRREAFGIVLSMPPGTNRASVVGAAREFAKTAFPTHQYVFASHEDEAHPHVHLCVKAVSLELVRLNPRKADLQEWREIFAEKLRDQGIEANATARAPRGRVLRPESGAVRHIERRGVESAAKQGRARAAAIELTGNSQPHPAEVNVSAQRARVVKGFGQMAKALAGSAVPEDRKLALKIVEHVRGMPPPKTERQLAVEARLEARSEATTQDRGENGGGRAW